ncbi:MAG: septal ring lytic transglycosylase RlpA family protein [Pseudolabrys sp.]
MLLGGACLALAACANSNMAGRDLAKTDAANSGTGKTAARKRATAHHAKSHSRKVATRSRTKQPKEPEPGPHEVGSYKNVSYSAIGLASWYGAGFHGRRTADGETFNMHAVTAAHRTLPLPCTVRVTNLANNRSLVVRVNDRGPYVSNRLIDVSARTAKLLGFYGHGLTRVKVDYIGRAPLPRGSRIKVTALE